MQYATKNDFSKAPVGHPFLECCSLCGGETGSILIKSRGFGEKKVGHDIPRFIVNPEAVCEFCQFLEAFLAQEGVDAEGKWGALKLVTEDGAGVRTLFAFVPFSNEDQENGVPLAGGNKVRPLHGMVIRCRGDGDKMILEEVVEPGRK